MWGFPGGSVVGNPAASAEEAGSIPGLGASYMPWNNYAHEPQLLSLCFTTGEATTMRSLHITTRE